MSLMAGEGATPRAVAQHAANMDQVIRIRLILPRVESKLTVRFRHYGDGTLFCNWRQEPDLNRGYRD